MIVVLFSDFCDFAMNSCADFSVTFYDFKQGVICPSTVAVEVTISESQV